MLAAGAGDDWRHSLSHNPALVRRCGQSGFAAAYCRPFGLEGVDWMQVAAAGRRGRWAGAAYAAGVSMGRYREIAAGLVAGWEPFDSLLTGTATRLLMVETARRTADVVPALDVGVNWRHGRLTLGCSVLSVNEPKFEDGEVVPFRSLLSASLRPTPELLLALDLSRTGSDETMAFGIEFNLASPLDLRVGVGYEPLVYGAGVGVHIGPVSVDYSYRYHSRMQETHVIGLAAEWR